MARLYGTCTLCGAGTHRESSKFCGPCWDKNRPTKNREGYRFCSTCDVEKPLTSEHFHRRPGGFNSVCKPCKVEYNREYRKKQWEEHGGNPYKHKQREYQLRHKYGLKPEDIPDACQLCGTKGSNTRQEICVDHCHTSGRVRGFLCHDCNLAIGKAQDDPNLLRRMADYLEKA